MSPSQHPPAAPGAPAHLRSPAVRARAAAAVACLAALGCAAGPRPRSDLVWPPAPDKPRVKYVGSFSSPADFDPSGWGRLRRAILGGDDMPSLYNPLAAALSADERRLYVSCPGKGYVLEFDLVRRRMRLAANASGHEAVQPSGLAVDANGDLYVADPGSRAVLVYSEKGEYLRTIGKGRLERPFGLAIDRRRRLVYVVDGGSRNSSRHLVEVFAPDGRHLRTIGGAPGSSPGQFAYPSYATVSPDGKLYVADSLNSRVQVFDPEGNLVTFFGAIGSGPGDFGKLKGLAFDAFGNLHAVDGLNTYVQVFNQESRLLMAYGQAGREPGFMQLPNGIAIDSRNNIYVVDFMNNVVNQYQLFNTSAADSLGDGGSAPATRDGAPTPAPSEGGGK